MAAVGCNSNQSDMRLPPPVVYTPVVEIPVVIEAEDEDAAPTIEVDEESILSDYSTKIKTEKGRDTNIELATKALNNTIIMPNEEFSFNKTIGERTEERGYKKAIVLFMGMKKKGIGGGICQVSSTLYAAVMYGGLAVTERAAHSRPSDYINQGLDAAVSYPDLDLKFINIFDVPIMIKAQINDDELIISIVGINDIYGEVRHVFYSNETIPYEQKIIKRPYHKGPPRIIQKGTDGHPGTSYWVYSYKNTKVRKTTKVRSGYKPVPEVWYAGKGPDSGVPKLIKDGGTNG